MAENPANPGGRDNRSLNDAKRGISVTAQAIASDESLIHRVRAKDHAAMAEIFDRYARMVYAVSLRVLNDSSQAEDVMQEIFLQIWKTPDAPIRVQGSLGSWLAVVARNRAIDMVRKRRPTDPVEEILLAVSTDLASEVARSRMMEKVREVLATLPEEQQRSLELAYFEGLSHSEIAAKTGDPLGTVKTRIRAALASLRKGIIA
jgi:RNA polymerase sigma-70 factor, ECF subfamily